MTGWFVLLVLLAAINPPRLRPYVDSRARFLDTVTAAGVVLVVGSAVAGFASGILDALDITVETWHLGAGVVGVLVGARVLVAPGISGVVIPDGRAAALVPFAFPLLFTPQLAVLMLLLGATESTPAAIAWLAVALAITVVVCAMPYRRSSVWSGSARLLGASLVVLSVALVVAGIRDV